MKKIKLNIQRYASGGFEFAASGYLQGKIEWVSTSNGSSANSSNVSMSLLARRTNNYSTTGTWTGNMNIQNNDSGVSYYGTIGNSWVVIGQKTVTVAHNNDGTCSCYIGGSVTGPSGTSLSGNTSVGSQWVTLDTIPRYATMTNATNFNDEQNPSFTYNNPANTSMSCWLEVNPTGEHLAVRNFSGTGGTYTWQLTEAERNQLRAKIPNNNSATCRIGLYSTLGGSTQPSFRDVSFTIVNANPTFSNFTFEDTNTTTTALTGNNQNIIPRYSNVKATISTTNKAEALKSATMSKYRFTVGNSSTDITYSDSASVNGTINNVENGTFNVYAIDSRNNSTLVTKLANQVINYSDVTIDVNSKVERSNGGVGGDVTLTYSGTFWNNNFGQVANSIKLAKYEFKKTTDTTWITGTTDISPTINNNNFSFSALVRSNNPDYTFDLESSYDFRVTISDELSTKTIQLTPLSSAVPNIALADDGVAIMGAYDDNLGGYLQVGGGVVGVYSTSEIKTNEIWINGKSIYQKAVEVNFGTAGTTEILVSHGISNIEYVTDQKLVWYDTVDKMWYQKDKDQGTSQYHVNIYGVSATQIRIIQDSTQGWQGRTADRYAIIKYTKTTD